MEDVSITAYEDADSWRAESAPADGSDSPPHSQGHGVIGPRTRPAGNGSIAETPADPVRGHNEISASRPARILNLHRPRLLEALLAAFRTEPSSVAAAEPFPSAEGECIPVPPPDTGPYVSRYRPMDEAHEREMGTFASPQVLSGEAASLPRLTSCIPNHPLRVPNSLSEQRLKGALAAALLLLAFGIGHIHLRFSVEDLQAQRVRLQGMRQSLEKQVSSLERSKAMNWHPEAVAETLRKKRYQYAAANPAYSSTAVVPALLRRKYEAAPRGGEMIPSEAYRSSGLQEGGRLAGLIRLLEAGKAYAAGNHP